MAQVHHASWHLLRKYKPKARMRRASRATAGVLGRKNEIVLIQMQQAVQRAEHAQALYAQTLYASIQTATIKAGA